MWGALNADPGTPQGKSCVEGEVDTELLADVTAPPQGRKALTACLPLESNTISNNHLLLLQCSRVQFQKVLFCLSSMTLYK